jgi:hypothetical protein
VDGPDSSAGRRLRLRFPGVCATCGITLSPGTEAFWNRETKQATCLACAPSATTITSGTAGASAASEGERRKARRVEQVRKRYGDHAAAVAEQMTASETAQTWGKGSAGESRLAAFVDRELGDRVIALHDRSIPGTRANIDHIFVALTGVWVVDAKAYKGKVVKRDVGPVWREENEVYVGGRNRTSLAKGVERQVDCVLAALRLDPEAKGTDVYGALCFLESEWDLLDFPFRVGTIWVLYPGALRKRLKKNGPLSREAMERLARRLDLSLPPADPG